MEGIPGIPVWPVHQGSISPRRMDFLFAEARWYIWVQEGNKQAISALRRNLLLLHQNGDLEIIKDLTVGKFVTALYESKMIRGRIIRPLDTVPQDKSENSKNRSKTVTLIDLDEGRIHTVAISQVRKIPQDFMTLPCQAIRCDIGLDCIEQFNWPPELNNMLHKALENAHLLVEHTAMQPGSIPTILAKITILNPATGQTMLIQKWLMDIFTPHLNLCSMEKFKPFPVGMTSDLMEKANGGQQQQVLGFGSQSKPPGSFSPIGLPLEPCTPPRLPEPRNMQPPSLVGMAISIPPGPNRMPASVQCIPPNMPPVLPYAMQPAMAVGFQPSYPPNVAPQRGICHAPSYNPGFQHAFAHPQSFSGHIPAHLPPNQGFMATRPLPSPAYREPIVSSTPIMSVSVKQPVVPTHPVVDMKEESSSMSSLLYKSDSSSSAKSSMYDVRVSTSSSTSSPAANREKGVNQPSDPIIPDNKERPLNVNSCGYGLNREKSKTNKNSVTAQSLNIDAPPFEGICQKWGTNSNLHSPSNADESKNGNISSSSNLSVNAPTFVPKFNSHSEKKSLVKENALNQKNAQIDKEVHTPNLSCSSSSPAGRTSIETGEEVLLEKESAQNKSNAQIAKEVHAPSPLCSSSRPVERNSLKTGKEVDLDFLDLDWKVGEVLHAFIADVNNPSCLEFNIVTELSGFLVKLQEEINNYYRSHKKKIISKQQAQDLCGNYCACYDADEKIWFRAHVDKWFMDDAVTPLQVWAVDLGGSSRVDFSHIQPLVTELACSLPCLVTLCSMKNIQPRSDNGIWPENHLERLKELLPEGKPLYLRVDGPISAEFKWPISVYFNAECSMESVNEILVSEGCASYVPVCSNLPDKQYEDDEDPMEEAYKIGGNNYDIDDEDACAAVSGRKIDETGICWFYNREGYCYKNFCTLKHVRLDPGGHSIEKVDIHTQPYEGIDDVFLAPGNRIKLTVTRILTVNHFIARVHLRRGTPGIQSRETLSSVIKLLNSKERKRSLKTFTEFPADGEIVLFKDETGTYYRGRVLGSDPTDDNLYEVLNVDSGYLRKVPLNNLRRVDPAFLHHPFEAVECWLADVSPTNNNPEWVKTCNTIFADLVKDKRMTATIIRSAPWGIEVNMCDKEGQDIAVALIDMNLVVKSPMRHLPVSDSQPMIPG